jgi:hypothetical protein
MPVKGGMRRNRNKQPTISRTTNDSSVIRYQAIGTTLTTDAAGIGYFNRFYVPGHTNLLASVIGSSIVAAYSTAKFLPGTTIRWEPSVSFTSTGRLYVAFTDNSEVAAAINALTVPARIAAVRGMGNVVSFPVWQETSVNFPTRLRRKTFDTNQTIDVGDVPTLDRSMQQLMLVAVDGAAAATSLGSFVHHDVLSVEGIKSIGT